MASDFDLESLEKVKKVLEKDFKPRHKVYIKNKTILIHKEDAYRDGWNLVKLCMVLRDSNQWYLDTYTDKEEYKWKIILWASKK